MDSLTSRRRKVTGLALAGFILLLVGIKFARQAFLPLVQPQSLDLNQQPALLFINVNEGCDCMLDLAQQANIQIDQWLKTQPALLPVHRIDFNAQKRLLEKYNVFRAPCLILLDGSGNILWRQDYPLAEGGPFDLKKLESEIEKGIVR